MPNEFILVCGSCCIGISSNVHFEEYEDVRKLIGVSCLYNCSLLDDLQEEDGNTANSYSTIACDHCMNSIGRNYLATIKVNETMLNFYWLDNIQIYELGGNLISSSLVSEYFERIKENQEKEKEKLRNEINQVQDRLLEINSRINALELLNGKEIPKPTKEIKKRKQKEKKTKKVDSSDEESFPIPDIIPDDMEDDEVDLSQYGTSESSSWGDGWKLSQQWIKKHPPTRVPQKRDCIVCGARCVMICEKCNVHLHTRNACYAKYHMNPEKYSNEPVKKGHVCKACGKPRKGHPGKPGLKYCIFANK